MASYIEKYDAYGRRDVMDSNFNMLSASGYISDTGFTGREIDMLDQGGLQHMHYRHRNYSPELGRFLQHDPLGIDPFELLDSLYYPPLQWEDGMNIYQYVKSLPIMGMDPYGLMTAAECLELFNERRDRAQRELGSCAGSCLGLIPGKAKAQCAMICAASLYISRAAFIACLGTCGTGGTLINIYCGSLCMRQFRLRSETLNRALEHCLDNACP